MVTIRDVAKKAAVSVTTVSHVVNQTRFVAEETEKRVRLAMEELDYRPNILARSLRKGATGTIGLVLPDSSNPFFAESGRLLEEAAFRRSFSLILCNSNGDLEKERRYTDVLFNKQVDGIIFMAAGDDTKSLSKLVELKLPVVVVDRILNDPDVDAVITDNHMSGYLATRHLIELGHQKIAIIRGPSNVNPSAQRVNGYRQALAEAGLPYFPELEETGDFHSSSGYIATKRLLQSVHPTAIFACNDLMAIGAIRAIHEAGLSIPGDISLVGHDDIELASYLQPPLTTIAQPIADLAETAVNFLIERIETPSLPPRKRILPNSLVVRNSTGRCHA